MKYRTLLLAAILAVLLRQQAQAGTVDMANTTTVIGSDGQAYTSVGAEFQTLGLSATGSGHGGSYALTLAYSTTFNGLFSSGGTDTYYPDIFLSVPGVSANTTGYDWTVSLGSEVPNGGQAAGFYTPASIADSQAVWSGRPGYIYGAGYQQNGGGILTNPPVIMLSGTQVRRTGVSSTVTDTHTQHNGQELYTLSVNITGLSSALAGMFANGFDTFWGTGDCANGAFLASTDQDPFVIPVAEPGTGGLALTGVGVVLISLRKKERKVFFFEKRSKKLCSAVAC